MGYKYVSLLGPILNICYIMQNSVCVCVDKDVAYRNCVAHLICSGLTFRRSNINKIKGCFHIYMLLGSTIYACNFSNFKILIFKIGRLLKGSKGSKDNGR